MAEVATGEPIKSLPDVDPTTGFLPPGVHRCTWAEFEYTFVDCAPHPDHRRRRLRALELWVECLDELLPESTLWIDGGFVSHKVDPPFDIDVLAKVKTAAWDPVAQTADDEIKAWVTWATTGQPGYPPKTPTAMQLTGLMTHQGVQPDGGGVLPRLQPFGGLIDGFVIPASQSATLANFRRDWMRDLATGASKGFVEVRPDGR